MSKWSRRKFLGVGAIGSLAIHAAPAAGLSPMPAESKAQPAKAAPGAFEEHDRAVLRAAMDELIPAGDGMPAASEVGGVEYLDNLAGRDKEVATKLQASLLALETLSQDRAKASFLALSREQRIESLAALEKGNTDAFKPLHDCVYEAYYTRPAVWKLVGYEFNATNMSGPHMKPFDETLLAEVRKKPKYYREVG